MQIKIYEDNVIKKEKFVEKIFFKNKKVIHTLCAKIIVGKFFSLHNLCKVVTAFKKFFENNFFEQLTLQIMTQLLAKRASANEKDTRNTMAKKKAKKAKAKKTTKKASKKKSSRRR